MKNRVKIGKSLVVHEGLQNHQFIKNELLSFAKELNDIANNTTSHLADIGCHLGFIRKKIESKEELLFELHGIEKEMELEQFNTLNP